MILTFKTGIILDVNVISFSVFIWSKFIIQIFFLLLVIFCNHYEILVFFYVFIVMKY